MERRRRRRAPLSTSFSPPFPIFRGNEAFTGEGKKEASSSQADYFLKNLKLPGELFSPICTCEVLCENAFERKRVAQLAFFQNLGKRETGAYIQYIRQFSYLLLRCPTGRRRPWRWRRGTRRRFSWTYPPPSLCRCKMPPRNSEKGNGCGQGKLFFLWRQKGEKTGATSSFTLDARLSKTAASAS